MISLRRVLSLLVALSAAAGAQRAAERPVGRDSAAVRDTSKSKLVTKTIELHHLTSKEATKLLAPYSRTAGGEVFDAPAGVRAVTIRETQSIINEMLSLLARYDREPATITLYFQLVAGYPCDSCAPGDKKLDAPLPDGLDSLMRKVLKYRRYRLLASTAASTDENSHVSLAMSADNDPMRLEVQVMDVRVDGTQPVIIIDGVRQPEQPASV